MYVSRIYCLVVLCGVITFANAADLVSTFLNGGTNSLNELSVPTASPIDTLDGRGGVSFIGTYTDWYRSGGMEQAGSSFSRTERVTSWQTFRAPVPFVVSISQFTGYTRIDQTVSTEHVKYLETPQEFGIEILASPYKMTWLRGGIAGEKSLPPNLMFGAGIDVPRFFSTQLEWIDENQSSHTKAEWEANSADIGLRTKTEGMTGSFSTEKIFGIRLLAEGSQKNWIRDTSDYSNPTYSPWGQSVGYRSALAWSAGNFGASVGVRGYRFDCMAYGAQDDITFSKLTAIHFRQDGYFGTAQWTNHCSIVRTEWEYQHWDGYSRGHVEFWPFTPGWESLLGARRYYIANASGKFLRARIAFDNAILDPKTHVSFSGDYIDCIVNASLEHWRPAFLVFGIADLQYSTLDLQRVSGTELGFRINHDFTDFQLEYQFQQMIPIRLQYSPTVSTTPTQPSAISSKHGLEYGGGFHTITISTNW